MSKKCTPLWREAHFEIKMHKTHQLRTTRRRGAKHISKSKCTKHTTFGPLLDVQSSFRVAGTRDCAPCQKWKTWGFCRISKNDGRRTFEEDLQRCIFRGKRSTKDVFMRDVRRSGRWFPARGCVSAALNFPFFKEVSQNCFDFDVVKCKIEEVSLNCCVFYAVNFEKWRGLAELLRFWRCQVQTLRKSRRIASFLMLSTLNNEDISQNSLVFKIADRQVDK